MREPPQVVALANGAATPTVETVRVVLPVFSKVTFWATLAVPTVWLPKINPETSVVPEVCSPTPAKETVFTPAFVSSVSIPVALPIAVGVNVTFNVQKPCPATVAGNAPQFWLAENGPDAVTAVTTRSVLPVLFSVTERAALVVRTF